MSFVFITWNTSLLFLYWCCNSKACTRCFNQHLVWFSRAGFGKWKIWAQIWWVRFSCCFVFLLDWNSIYFVLHIRIHFTIHELRLPIFAIRLALIQVFILSCRLVYSCGFSKLNFLGPALGFENVTEALLYSPWLHSRFSIVTR